MLLSKRKRDFLTEEEQEAQVEVKRQRQIDVQTRKVQTNFLRHKVVSLYLNGCFTDDFQFRPHQTKQIVEFFQSNYERYRNQAAAKSFVYRCITRHKKWQDNPHLDPQRDRRGENRPRWKRGNPRTRELCEELLGEEKTTAPKVQSSLQQQGISVSRATIRRIATDLKFRWTKP